MDVPSEPELLRRPILAHAFERRMAQHLVFGPAAIFHLEQELRPRPHAPFSLSFGIGGLSAVIASRRLRISGPVRLLKPVPTPPAGISLPSSGFASSTFPSPP